MQPSRSLTLSATVLAFAGALASPSSHAVTQDRSLVSNAAGLCQSALPAFEGLIRKRPLSVQNEGTSTAFVTCALTAQSTGLTAARIYFHSVDGVERSVSCTGVAGYYGDSTAVVKTATVTSSGQVSLVWYPSDFGDGLTTIPGIGRFAASCALEPNVGIDDIASSFKEEVGA